jgi:hypothetical protein
LLCLRGVVVLNAIRIIVVLAVFAYVSAGMHDPDLVPDWLKFSPQVGCVH